MSKPGNEPKVRHEFVGMMFAVTIGEVGLQVASLVQAKHYEHFLPFYFHLILATIVITSSWVGWSLSQAPGARRDVKGIFTWGFITLLLDVSLVILYFIMVRTIELGNGAGTPRIESPEKFAGLIVAMFVLFLVWDVVTKWCAYNSSNDGPWRRNCGLRMIPTSVCLPVAIVVFCLLKKVDLVHYISADLALLALALLFRSLKDVISEGFPKLVRSSEGASDYVPEKAVVKGKVVRAIKWSLVCLLGVILGTAWTKYSWPLLPSNIAQEINASLSPERSGAMAISKPIGVSPKEK